MDIRIDRLSLQVSGMRADTAGQFGRLVAERLGALLAAGPPASGPARLARLHVSVPGAAGSGQDALAQATAAEIARALRAQVTR